MVQVAGSNVKPFQCVHQSVAGQVAQEVVEHAEGKAHFLGVFNVLDGLKRLRSVDKAKSAPE